jgi:hypothetical protein
MTYVSLLFAKTPKTPIRDIKVSRQIVFREEDLGNWSVPFCTVNYAFLRVQGVR